MAGHLGKKPAAPAFTTTCKSTSVQHLCSVGQHLIAVLYDEGGAAVLDADKGSLEKSLLTETNTHHLAKAGATALVVDDAGGTVLLSESAGRLEARDGFLDRAATGPSCVVGSNCGFFALACGRRLLVVDQRQEVLREIALPAGDEVNNLCWARHRLIASRSGPDTSGLLCWSAHGSEDAVEVQDSRTDSRFTCLAASPCGNFLAAGLEDGQALIWALGHDFSAASLDVLSRNLPHNAPIEALAWDSDADVLAVSDGAAVYLWDLSDSAKSKTSPVQCCGHQPRARITSLAFHANMPVLATGADHGQVLVYDATDLPAGGSLQPRMRATVSKFADCVNNSVTALAWLPSTILAAGCADGRVVSWETSTVSQQNGHSEPRANGHAASSCGSYAEALRSPADSGANSPAPSSVGGNSETIAHQADAGRQSQPAAPPPLLQRHQKPSHQLAGGEYIQSQPAGTMAAAAHPSGQARQTDAAPQQPQPPATPPTVRGGRALHGGRRSVKSASQGSFTQVSAGSGGSTPEVYPSSRRASSGSVRSNGVGPVYSGSNLRSHPVHSVSAPGTPQHGMPLDAARMAPPPWPAGSLPMHPAGTYGMYMPMPMMPHGVMLQHPGPGQTPYITAVPNGAAPVAYMHPAGFPVFLPAGMPTGAPWPPFMAAPGAYEGYAAAQQAQHWRPQPPPPPMPPPPPTNYSASMGPMSPNPSVKRASSAVLPATRSATTPNGKKGTATKRGSRGRGGGNRGNASSEDSPAELSSDCSSSLKTSTSEAEVATPVTTIYCGNLTPQVHEQALVAAFSPFGLITACEVVRERLHRESRGFGFITFAHASCAASAMVNMDGAVLYGPFGHCPLRVAPSTRDQQAQIQTVNAAASLRTSSAPVLSNSQAQAEKGVHLNGGCKQQQQQQQHQKQAALWQISESPAVCAARAAAEAAQRHLPLTTPDDAGPETDITAAYTAHASRDGGGSNGAAYSTGKQRTPREQGAAASDSQQSDADAQLAPQQSVAGAQSAQQELDVSVQSTKQEQQQQEAQTAQDRLSASEAQEQPQVAAGDVAVQHEAVHAPDSSVQELTQVVAAADPHCSDEQQQVQECSRASGATTSADAATL